MAFLDKLGDIAKNIGDKTTDAIETGKLNSKINSEKTAIAECMRQIGDYYCKKREAGEPEDAGVVELFAAIDGHNKAIADAQAEIEHIKAENAAQAQAATAPISAATIAQTPLPAADGIVCLSCGIGNIPGTKFCCGCGAKLEIPAPAAGETVCPSCGKANVPGTKFCCECGVKLEIPAPAAVIPTALTCPSCGRENPIGIKFCCECGYKFE